MVWNMLAGAHADRVDRVAKNMLSYMKYPGHYPLLLTSLFDRSIFSK